MWPAYTEAHSKHFEDGEVEHGALRAGQGIHLLEERQLDMQAMVEASCKAILAEVEP